MADASQVCPSGLGWKDACPICAWPQLNGTTPFMPGAGSLSPWPLRALSMFTSRKVLPLFTLAAFALPLAACASADSHLANMSE